LDTTLEANQLYIPLIEAFEGSREATGRFPVVPINENQRRKLQ
jgi:hypothetical protein